MTRPLTNQQQIVYNLIRDRIISRGYGPTVREIGEHMNIKSPNGVMCHLRALERKGVIRRSANKSRAIELTESISSLVGATLQVDATIVDGVCTASTGISERIDLANLTSGLRSFYRVEDDSLIAAQIQRGDLLVVQRQSQASGEQLAVVRTGGGETCLRYVSLEQEQIRLQPIDAGRPSTLVDRAEVLGVVAGVVRVFKPWI